MLLAASVVAGPLAALSGLVRIVYTFGAGGSGDVTGRLVAEHMQKSLGVPVILENKVGASGRIAVDAVKSAAPDGNTLLLAFMGTMVILPHTVDNVRFDPFNDFVPVAHVADSPRALTVASTTQARDAKEYVAQVKSGRTAGFVGLAPLGGLPHFLGLQFAAVNGIELTVVGYKGGAQMAQAVMAGEVPATYSTPADLVALAQGRQGAHPGGVRAPAECRCYPTCLHSGRRDSMFKPAPGWRCSRRRAHRRPR